jgi:hypothetical protein
VVGAGGGGAGGNVGGAGAHGAVRIVWPGNNGARAFPSSNVNTV